MSIKVMTQVWEHQAVKGTDKLALLALADHANDNGYCYPSYDALALKVGVGRRQIINVIEKLVERGEVWVIGIAGHRNRYIVVTGQDRDGILKRLNDSGKMDKSEAETAADLIIKRQGGEADCTGEIQSKGGEADCTGGVKPISPKPLKNRQSKPSEQNNSVATDAPPPSLGSDVVEKSPLPNDTANNKTLDLAPPSGSRKAPTPDAAAPPSPPEPKPTDHPFVQVYREVFQRYPNRAQMAQLAKMIVTPPGLAKWRESCTAWLLAGYKPDNLRGILDWYRTGVPQYAAAIGQNYTRAAPKPQPGTEYEKAQKQPRLSQEEIQRRIKMAEEAERNLQ